MPASKEQLSNPEADGAGDREPGLEGSSGTGRGKLPSGRHNLPREFVVRNQRTRIVDGLAKAMARQGYVGTSVADILAEAGVSRRTFYEHYRSKEDCFLRAFDVVAAGFAQRVEDVYRAPGPWRERVTRALATLLDVLRREPELARMCMVESLSAGPPAMARFTATVDRFEGLFAEAARRSPHGDRLPPHLPRTLVGGISSLIYRELTDAGADDLPRLLPELVYMTLVPYLGIDEALAAAEAAGPLADELAEAGSAAG